MDEGREIFEWFKKEHDRIVAEAKENGTWKTLGFDGNQHLFKDLIEETRAKLAELKKSKQKQ